MIEIGNPHGIVESFFVCLDHLEQISGKDRNQLGYGNIL